MSEKHENITTLALKTFTVVMPETTGAETVTVKIVRVSDGYTWDFSALEFNDTINTSLMTYVSDYIWKQSFTPPTDDEYIGYIYDDTNLLTHWETFTSISAGIPAIILPDPDDGSHYATAVEVCQILKQFNPVDISDRWLTMADDLINSYLGQTFALPFSSTPPMVKSMAINIACYYAMRSMFTMAQQNDSKWIVDFYNKAVDDLELLKDGKLALVDAVHSIIDRGNMVYSTTDSYKPTFGENDPENQIVDGQKLDDLNGGV